MMDDLEILRAACCVAGVDGCVDAGERAIIDRLAERAGVGAVSLEAMVERATEDRAFFEKQLFVLRGDPEAAMRRLFDVAVADGRLDPSERIVLQFLADRVGLDRERTETLLAEAEGRCGGG